MSNDFCASGKYQSPIDIKSNNTIRCGALCDLTFYYRTSKANIINADKRILLDYDTGSYVMYNNEVYELDKISFSVPAAQDRKSTRLNSSHSQQSRMPSSA